MLGFPKQFEAVNIKIRDQLKNQQIGQRTNFMVKRTFSIIYFSGSYNYCPFQDDF